MLKKKYNLGNLNKVGLGVGCGRVFDLIPYFLVFSFSLPAFFPHCFSLSLFLYKIPAINHLILNIKIRNNNWVINIQTYVVFIKFNLDQCSTLMWHIKRDKENDLKIKRWNESNFCCNCYYNCLTESMAPAF